MIRWIAAALFLGLALGALGQDADDEETDIEINSAPEAGDEEADEPEKTPDRPARKGGGEFTSGKFTIRMPEEWIVEERDSDSVFGFVVELPGTTSRAQLVVMQQETLGDPRRGPYHFRASAVENLKAKRTEIRSDPLPLLLAYFEQSGEERVAAFAFRAIKGNGFFARLDCAPAAYDEAEKPFTRAVLAIEADLDRFPPIPESFETTKKGRFLWAVHPGVKGSIRFMQKIAAAQEKRFVKVHGKPPLPADGEEPVIYVLSDRMQAAPLFEVAAGRDFTVDVAGRRLFAEYLGEESETNVQGSFAGFVQRLLFVVRYGDARPDWLAQGEQSVAFAEYMTGKPLPYLHSGMIQGGQTLTPIDELDKLRETNEAAWGPQLLYHVGLLRAGPGKYRRAYKDFLKEYLETHDWETALANRLGSLGYAELRDAAQHFMDRSLRPHEPKH